MTSLSNVIKSERTSSTGFRILDPKPIAVKAEEIQDQVELTENAELEQMQAQKEDLFQDLLHVQQQLAETRERIIAEQERAKLDIEQWWSESKQELEVKEQEALELATKRGFEEGYQQGYNQIQEELKSKLQEMTQTVQLAYEHKERIIQDAEPFLLSLSSKIAEKILHNELIVSEEQIVALVQAGLKQVKDRGEVIIEVCSQDYPVLIAHLDELEQYLDDNQELKIIPTDVENTSRGCLIHTEHGTYDVTIDQQLQELKNQLLALFEESVAE